jgi:hypothetical protein
MRSRTVAVTPLLSDPQHASLISRTILNVGITKETVLAWQQLCRGVRFFCFENRLLNHWPTPVIYADYGEAADDQLMPSSRELLIAGMSHARGWAVFDVMDAYCRRQWRGMDRSIVHLRRCGGPWPLLLTLTHEVGHHHLWQVRGIPIRDQTRREVEEEVNDLATTWVDRMPDAVKSLDNGAAVRTLDILLPHGGINDGSES